jgi:hypothetical protein
MQIRQAAKVVAAVPQLGPGLSDHIMDNGLLLYTFPVWDVGNKLSFAISLTCWVSSGVMRDLS